MKRTKFSVILDLWISLVINVILSFALPLLAIGFINLGIFMKGFVIAFIVSTAFVFIVPIVKWGDAFATLFKAKPFTVPFQMLSTIVIAIFLGTLMSLLMTGINAGVGPFFIRAWLSFYPAALLIVYVSALLGIWTGIPLCKKICNVPGSSGHTGSAHN